MAPVEVKLMLLAQRCLLHLQPKQLFLPEQHILVICSDGVYDNIIQVLSGSLDWSAMHTSADFWRENVSKFEEKDYQILRVLLKLLEASRDVRPHIT